MGSYLICFAFANSYKNWFLKHYAVVVVAATGPSQRDQVPGLLCGGQRAEHRAGAGRCRGPLAHDQALQEAEAPHPRAHRVEVFCSAVLGA